MTDGRNINYSNAPWFILVHQKQDCFNFKVVKFTIGMPVQKGDPLSGK